MKNTNTQEATVLPPPRPTLLSDLQCSAIIALCFLWTSTGYLSWMYHLLDFAESSCVDWLTEVIGYLFQALGVLLFSLVIRRKYSKTLCKRCLTVCISMSKNLNSRL